MPILSIIVPVYNVERYLDNCIQSILCQTYQDWELILVDDGSTDNSGRICDDYLERDKRIRVIHKVNGGLASARNTGLEASFGRYVTYVDSDDDVECDTYELNMSIMMNHPGIDMLCYPIIYQYNTPQKRKEQYPKQILSNPKEIFLSWYNHRPIDKSSCTKIFKKTSIGNIRYPVGHIHEDFFFMLSYMQQVGCVYISDKGCYHYYSSNNSILHTPSLQKDKDWVDAELTMLQQMYHYPEISSEYLGRYMSTARYLMNTTIKFPNAEITCQLKHLKDSIPPIQCLWKGKQRPKDIFWYLNIRILGVFLFSQLYIFFLYKSIH